MVVDTIVDEYDGDLSLREAVGLANGSIGADAITFAPHMSGQVINFSSGEMRIHESVTIDATAADVVTVDASSGLGPSGVGEGSRIFFIQYDANNVSEDLDVTLSGLFLTGGNVDGHGGAIYSERTNLTLTRMTIYDNFATGNGGGVWHDDDDGGTFVMEYSTVSDNVAASGSLGTGTGSGFSDPDGGGGIRLLFADGEIINSTISGNLALNRGGGLNVTGYSFAQVLFTTISHNVADDGDGGGVYVDTDANLGLYHAIVANNTAATGPDIFATSDVPVIHSLVENGTGFAATSNPRIIGSDPMLGPLADNGGPTQTHALLEGSLAIDGGDSALAAGVGGVPEFDQRGSPFGRVVHGGLGFPVSVIDMGAYEFNPQGPSLPGDFNEDGFVDAADYTVYKDNEGSNTPLPNDDGLGMPIGTAHYDLWVDNFGNMLGTGAAVGVSLSEDSPQLDSPQSASLLTSPAETTAPVEPLFGLMSVGASLAGDSFTPAGHDALPFEAAAGALRKDDLLLAVTDLAVADDGPVEDLAASAREADGREAAADDFFAQWGEEVLLSP